MFYLLIGVFVFLYFHKKFDVPVFVESKKTTISNLMMVMIMILIWPLFIVLEITQRIRGVK